MTHNANSDRRRRDAGREGRVETVAGHDVIRPDTAGGVNLDAAKRREAQRGNPVEDVINRRTHTAYHVAPNAGSDTDSPGVGVLVTFTRVSKADSWTDTCLRGTSRQLNTAADVTVEAYVSPLARHTSLPDAASYDAASDPHAERVTGPATIALPDSRLREDGIDTDRTTRHDLIPENATWYRLDS